MFYLLLVSIVWGFSFGLIKGTLSGLDSNFVSCARMAISLLVFLPFFRFSKVNKKTAYRLVGVGVIQYGVMYIAYIYAFKFLKSYEVALFTIFTPIFVTIVNDIWEKRVNLVFLTAALLSVAGAGVIYYKGAVANDILIGFILMQISNLGFAYGQVAYKRVLRDYPGVKDQQIFALPYLGAFLITALATGISTGGKLPAVSQAQVMALLYLGVVASGVCFFLWNLGARKVDVGTLAVFNDLKIPMAVIISLVFFNEKASLDSLLIGLGIMLAALFLARFWGRRRQKQLASA
jgi:drug/metabolite transporter (DMT)-like permease